MQGFKTYKLTNVLHGPRFVRRLAIVTAVNRIFFCTGKPKSAIITPLSNGNIVVWPGEKIVLELTLCKNSWMMGSWFKDGDKVEWKLGVITFDAGGDDFGGVPDNHYRLTIASASIEDSGKYTFEVRTDIGSDSCTFDVEVKGKSAYKPPPYVAESFFVFFVLFRLFLSC